MRFNSLSRFLAFLFASSVAPTALQAANGSIYYNEIATANSPVLLRRINGDGTGAQQLAINLPSTLYPAISRNGRILLVTSPDPGRPFKISQNVYVIDLITGAMGRATTYLDEFELGGMRFQDDLGKQFGTLISSYVVNFPYHKALSPEGSRVVVMEFQKAAITSQVPSPLSMTDVQSASQRIPIVDVFNLSDALPAGPFVFKSAQERNGLNQGGDGVDWHPALNEVVAAVDTDIRTVGNFPGSGLQGTVLAVYSTASISPFLRRLTDPVAQRDIDPINTVITAASPHDYSPSISSDGTRVAYARHLMRQDTRFDAAGIAPLPALCSIRVVNYNGTGDHEIISFPEGAWVTKVAFSPDGTQIAFDLAPQQILNNWYAPLGDVTRSTVNIVNADGSNPRLLAAAPAAYPSWGPSLAPASQPQLQFRRTGNTFELRVNGLAAGTPFVVEGSVGLGNFGSIGSFTAAGSPHFINITPNPNARFAVYRVRL